MIAERDGHFIADKNISIELPSGGVLEVEATSEFMDEVERRTGHRDHMAIRQYIHSAVSSAVSRWESTGSN